MLFSFWVTRVQSEEGEEEDEHIYDARYHANPYILSTTVLSDIGFMVCLWPFAKNDLASFASLVLALTHNLFFFVLWMAAFGGVSFIMVVVVNFF